MLARIVEISSAAYVHVRQGQVLVERDDAETARVPLDDLGILILDHPAIRLSQALLAACSANSVVIVASDSKHLPTSLTVPTNANTLHGRYVSLQAAMSLPTRKRIWQTVVRAKIQAQGRCLSHWGAESLGLERMATRVRSGDPDNLEAQAARLYWPALFGAGFRRSNSDDPLNALLNYGYAIVRAAVARAICAAGLHPGLGVHHHNQYDAFCLADDLMEPLRPFVDTVVMGLRSAASDAAAIELDRSTKQALLGVLTIPVGADGEQRLPLMSALHPYAVSFREAMSGGKTDLTVPTA
jgi:CRISPR-associated protein Cas1